MQTFINKQHHLEDYQGPEAILGEDGLFKQLTKSLVERALQAELFPNRFP